MHNRIFSQRTTFTGDSGFDLPSTVLRQGPEP